MKKLLAMFAVIGLLGASISGASAFSTEQRDDRNSDGTPKFADPDEQMPNLVMNPEQAQQNLQAMPFDPNPITPPPLGDRDAGAAAFNRAYSHLQNSR